MEAMNKAKQLISQLMNESDKQAEKHNTKQSIIQAKGSKEARKQMDEANKTKVIKTNCYI